MRKCVQWAAGCAAASAEGDYVSERVRVSKDDLLQHLREQVAFLCRSASSFEAGFRDEAKRLAHGLRVLLHQTKNSSSLIGQTAVMEGALFLDTCKDCFGPNYHGPESGLTRMVFGAGEAVAEAPLGDISAAFGRRLRRFDDWWDQPVIRDGKDSVFTRRDLVLNLADTDGGSHVDPSLNPEYEALTRQNTMDWRIQDGENLIPLVAPHLASIRQITFEFLCSLAYLHPEVFGDLECLRGAESVDLSTAPLGCGSPSRNDPCPCGSGRKYKKCHLRVDEDHALRDSASGSSVHHYSPSSITVHGPGGPEPDSE